MAEGLTRRERRPVRFLLEASASAGNGELSPAVADTSIRARPYTPGTESEKLLPRDGPRLWRTPMGHTHPTFAAVLNPVLQPF